MKNSTRTAISFFATFILTIGLYAQVTLRLVSIPLNTPADAEIFFAGSIQGWSPGSPAWKLTKGGDGIYSITIPEGTGTVQYKFTLGGWDKVEKGPSGEEIANRTFTFNGSPQTINLTVASWAGAPVSTAASNVQIMSNSFNMPQLGRTRRIWLYLPPDYNTTSKRYPVIYMQDGQNLFDNATAFSGEWQVDETLNQLHNQGNYGAIVVGIDNGGAQRLNEYSPWNNSQYGGGQGDAYINFIVQTLKPHIDANYRTLEGAENTCLFGSSMGGLIALYGAAKFPEVFGKVGSFSPAYWFTLTNLNQFILNNTANIGGMRIAHVAGQNESATMVTHLNQVTENLLTKGLLSTNSNIKIDADGTHSEAYWRREFGAAYQWLFASSTLPVQWGYFKSINQGSCTALLQWQTHREFRNKGFEVEKSMNGNSFTKEAFVAGAGNNTLPETYSHKVAMPEKGRVLYRLKQIDFDGNYSYSSVVSIEACNTGNKAGIFPNPTKDFFSISPEKINHGSVVQLYSSEGKLIKSWIVGTQNRFELRDLSPSLYFVAVDGTVLGRCLKF
jgi:alpha-glucosidase